MIKDDYIDADAAALLRGMSADVLRASPILMRQILDPEFRALSEPAEASLPGQFDAALDEESKRGSH